MPFWRSVIRTFVSIHGVRDVLLRIEIGGGEAEVSPFVYA